MWQTKSHGRISDVNIHLSWLTKKKLSHRENTHNYTYLQQAEHTQAELCALYGGNLPKLTCVWRVYLNQPVYYILGVYLNQPVYYILIIYLNQPVYYILGVYLNQPVYYILVIYLN